MTEHRPIAPPDRNGRDRRRSLLERAEDAFGLSALGPAAVPSDLNEAARTPSAPDPGQAERVGPAGQGSDTARALAPTGPSVFSGPCQAVDRAKLREEGLLVPEDPVTGQLEEFRIVKRELLAEMRSGTDPLANRILVCSPHSGEGKTYCATNLAIAMAAERDIEVVLVDADVVAPSVTQRLGIEGGPGLMDVLADPALKVEDHVIRTDVEGLFVLPAGSGNVRDAEYLASERTGEVLARLTRGAPRRVLVFDTPPALAASPAAELAGHVGQALLVVRAEETSRAALGDARQLLSACPDIKLLLNAARFSPSGRRFGEYGKGRV